MTVSLLPLLLACWVPRETGPTTMVGKVVDPSGAPLPGVEVETVEARKITDDEGRFGVHYKEPTQWVTFVHEGVRFRRYYRPTADDGVDVTLRVPPLTRRPVICEAVPHCRARLVWKLEDAFQAEVDVPCDARGRTGPVSAPDGPPDEATCRTSTDPNPIPARVDDRDGALMIRPLPVRVEVTLFTRQLPEPSACEVRADGVPLSTTADGVYAGEVSGAVTFTAWCDGVPSLPVRAAIAQPTRLEIEWQHDVPRLDLRTHAPWADRLLLAPIEASGSSGWVLEVPVGKDGTFRLPPLGTGTWAVGINLDPDRLLVHGREGDLRPGTLYVTEVVRSGVDATHPAAHGVLRVERTLGDATLDVDWMPMPPPSEPR